MAPCETPKPLSMSARIFIRSVQARGRICTSSAPSQRVKASRPSIPAVIVSASRCSCEQALPGAHAPAQEGTGTVAILTVFGLERLEAGEHGRGADLVAPRQ